MKILTSILVGLSISFLANASDPVPAARLPFGGTWEGIVGVSNGIPNRTTTFTNFSPGASLAQINNGIAVCPSNQVVTLAAGTYNFSSGTLTLGKNGVTVRGATNSTGVPTTVLVIANLSDVDIGGVAWDSDSPAQYSNINVSSGLTRGSTSMVLASTPTGLTSGMILILSAPRNAPTLDGNSANYYANWFGSTDNHPYSEGFRVTSVSGTTVGFWPPLNSDYLSGTCKVHYRTFASQIVMAGYENLVFTNQSGFFNCDIVSFQGAIDCWLKNCFLYGVGQNCNPGAGIKFYISQNCEVRQCRVENAAANGSSEYGMDSFHASGLLIEDNVFTKLPNVMPQIATSRSAFCFNVFTNEPYQQANWLSQIVFSHGAHNSYNLNEGNFIPSHFNDTSLSGNFSHSRNVTYFRERLSGWDGNGNKTDNCHPISFQDHHDNVTVAGCVMGTAGVQSQYFQNTGGAGGVNSIFNYDSTSGATLTKKGNYNTFNSGINASETLAGGEVLATSYIHSSKPSWFGSLPWPWVDPGNFAQANNMANLPSGYRFINNTFIAVNDPVINTQPANQTVISGQTASFTVIASGGSTLHYQWRKNGSNVGSDSSAFSFATINSDNLASILVTVTDNAGSLDSSTATLTVITNPIPFVNPTTLAYGLNPTNTFTNSSFTISNAGGGTLSGNAIISAPYSVISGSSYSLSAGQAQTVTIAYSPTLNQTDNGIVNLTGGGSTNVVISGTGYYVYNPGIIPMAGVTLFAPMQINVQGSIFQIVTTGASSGGRAIVGLNLSSPTTITISGNVIATNTANNTLAIDIDSDPTATTQEWSITNLTANVLSPRVVSKRGTGSGNIPQFSTNTWSLASGLHLIELRGIEANTFVNQLTINATNDPAITVQPVNQTVTAGGNATFTVTATGNSTLHYQWIFNGLNVGSDSSSYTRNNCQVADNGGTMVVNVSDASGSVNSQNATLIVNAQILNSGITIQGKFKVTGKAKLNQ